MRVRVRVRDRVRDRDIKEKQIDFNSKIGLLDLINEYRYFYC